MIREIDARTTVDRLDDARREALHEAATSVSDDVLPGQHRIRVASFDPATGNAAVVVSDDAGAQPGDYVARAIRHVQRIGPALGLTAEQAPEYAADPTEQATSTGAVAVHLRQLYKGIPVYDASETVRFDADGRLLEVAGRSVSVTADIPVTTTVTPEDALRLAAAHVADGGDGPDDAPRDQFGEPLVDPTLELTDFAPEARTSGADRLDRPTTFDAPPFPHVVTVALTWLPMGDGLRLCWHTKLAVPGGAVYRLLVDANAPTILLATRLTRGIAGRGDVVLTSGGTRGPITMPLPASSYGAPVPADLPADFPFDWLLDGTTRGTTVEALVEPAATTVSGTVQSGTVVFAAAPGSNDSLVVNLFALLQQHARPALPARLPGGRRELPGGQPRARRPGPGLRACPRPPRCGLGDGQHGHPAGREPAHDEHGTRHLDQPAHRAGPRRGLPRVHPRPDQPPGRRAAQRRGARGAQSRGMGEGWSDYFACTALGKTVVGDWVVDRPAGIRSFPYDESFPDTYADLGTGRYAADDEHSLGELWCAVLMSLARRVGAWTFTQIVVDGLKLTSANPSFLGARDAILLAADQHARAQGDVEPQAFVHTLWEVFARYGMGPGARTGGADVVTGVVADFGAPPAPTTGTARVHADAVPRAADPGQQPVGGGQSRSPCRTPGRCRGSTSPSTSPTPTSAISWSPSPPPPASPCPCTSAPAAGPTT